MSPQIPVYNRQVRPTTQAPSAQRSESFAGATGEAIQGMGQTLGSIAEKLKKVEQLNQLNKAELKKNKWRNKIRIDSAKNPQEWDMDRFEREKRKKTDEILSGIKDPQLRDEFRVGLQKDFGISKLRVFNDVQNYKLKQTAATGLDNTEELAEEYASEDNASVRKGIMAKIDSKFGDMISIGALDAVQAKRIKDSLMSDLGVRRATRDQKNKGVDYALANLMDGEYRVTTEQKEELEDEFLKIQKTEEKEAEIDFDTRQTQEGIVIIERFIQGEDVLEDAKNMKGSQEINSDIADAVIKAQTSPKALEAETDGNLYTDLTRRANTLEVDDRKDSRKILIEGLKAAANGKLEKKHLGRIIEINKMAFGVAAEPEGWNKFKKEYRKLTNWFKEWVGTDQLEFLATDNYLRKTLGENKDPEEAREEAIDEAIIEENAEQNKKIRVKRKSDGKIGTLNPEDFNSEIYKKLGN